LRVGIQNEMESSLSILLSGARLDEVKRDEEAKRRREEEQLRAPLRLCSWPDELEGNCILSVEGTEVHVNKTYLSMHSPIFHRMFYGDYFERANDRYEVNEVNADAFIDMLRVILPTRKPIDEKNVESLLVIADRFMMDHLRKDCITFLCSDSEAAKAISCVVLIVLAFRYDVQELKARVSARLFTTDSIISLRDRYHCGGLWYRSMIGSPYRIRRPLALCSHCPRFDELNTEARAWLFNLIISRPSSQSMKRVLCNDRCRQFDCSGRCTVCGHS
ncbi:hypothetical protein PENTCL1PPCAC_7833, partial [Pristionchus entomophagus]